jgi:hypothetical protein
MSWWPMLSGEGSRIALGPVRALRAQCSIAALVGWEAVANAQRRL